MKKMWVLVSLILSVLVISACSNQAAEKPKHLADLVSYFKDKGFAVGSKSEKAYQMIGAINGFETTLDGEQVELYEFDPKQSNATLEQVKKDGKFANNDAAVNGNFMIVEYFGPGEEKVDKAFREFK